MLYYDNPMSRQRLRSPRWTGLVPRDAAYLDHMHPRDLASALWSQHGSGRLPKAHAVAMVPRLWILSAPSPLSVLAPEHWRDLFGAAGFTDSAYSRERPSKPCLLFRGGSSDGWSWTDDAPAARSCAGGLGDPSRQHGGLWATLAPPAAMLAWVPLACAPDGRVRKWECVVDPEQLEEVRPWTAEERRQWPAAVASDVGGGRVQFNF